MPTTNENTAPKGNNTVTDNNKKYTVYYQS